MLAREAAMGGSVLVLGANGRLGQVLVDAFRADGWRVAGQVRRTPARTAQGVRWVQAPLAEPAALAEAAGPADVVMHAANPVYTRWAQDAMPMARQAMDVARRLSAVLLFPGNVYNFGRRMPELLSESTAQHPTARKGRIRVALESAMREAARAGLRVTVVRAGDFFGGPSPGSWLDMVIAKSLRNAKVVYPGRTDIPHAWAYLPDLARTFVMVANRRTELPVYETLHFPGHSPTGEGFLQALERAARRLGILGPDARLRRATMPWSMLRIGGLVVPMWRELAEMRYLWDVPHRLSGERLEKLLGKVPHTPLDEALEAALRDPVASEPRTPPVR
jgi:nucleoside-diphosphate-sugar epimerase